jgi:hypothetical protein
VGRDAAARILGIAALVAVFLAMYLVAAVLVAIILFGFRFRPPRLNMVQCAVLALLVIGDLFFRGAKDAAALAVLVLACWLMATLSRRRTSSAGGAAP